MTKLSFGQRMTIMSGGILCCEVSDVYEALESLLGHPAWTHEIPNRIIDAQAALIIADEGYEWPADRDKHPIETAIDVVGR